MSNAFPSILVLLFCGNCLLVGNAQNQLYNTRNNLLVNSIDTANIIGANWQQIKQQYQNGDTSGIPQLLKKHQILAHQYGFRFDQQFESARLNFRYHQLFDELFILEDVGNNLTIETILEKEYQTQFVPNHSESTLERDVLKAVPVPTAFNPSSTYWVKLKATNTEESAMEAWLMIGWNERSWESIAIYQDDGTTVKQIGSSGLRTPVAEKMAADWRNLVQLKVPSGRQYTYYFKLEGTFFPKYPGRISFYHFDEPNYWSKKSFSLFGDGVFLGITTLLLLIVSLLYYYDSAKDTLFFLIQLVGVWLHDFADSANTGSSHFFNELFPGALEAGQVIAILGFLMMIHGGVLFPLIFLEAKKYAPRLRKWSLRILYLQQLTYFLLALFNLFLYKYVGYPYEWIEGYISFFMLLLIFTTFFIFSICISAWRQKQQLGKISVLAYLPLVIISLVVFAGEVFFNISDGIVQFIFRVGFIGTYFLFTVAIFYKRQMERRDSLEKRLALKTQLNQEQQEAQRLKELDTFKTRLYTNLTHEFRTPLTVILGLTRELTNLPKKALTNAVTVIERNSENLLQLINQLLDLSKLENNSVQLNLQQSDLIPFLRYITESFQSYANTKNLSLRFETNLTNLTMDFAPQQITQIMTNLLSNALKFTPSEGSVRVIITAEKEAVLVKITDTGIGIPKEQLRYIFDRFYQVDDSTTRVGEGTGIGLAYTKEMIKLMNGTINVESTLGVGTTFFVRLPITKSAPTISTNQLKEVQQAEKNKPLVPTELATSPIIPALDGRPQILIIEDNPDVVFYLKSCLAPHYELTVAYNGRIGIEKAVATIPDIIISDVMMPDKDGYEVCQTLKNEEKTSHIPIILLTAKADAASKHTGFSKGADAYLIKPFDKAELMIRLQQMIQKKARLLAFLSRTTTQIALEKAPQQVAEALLIEDAFLQKVRQIIEKHYADNTFGLPQLCQKIGMSRSQLFRKLKALTGTSPSAFIRSYRLQKAKALLEKGTLNVSEVAWETGFINLAHFSKVFQEEFGVLPSSVI